MTPGRLVKINDREVSETEASLRDMADGFDRWTWLDTFQEDAATLHKAADEYAALEQDLAAALQTIRERTDERDALLSALRPSSGWSDNLIRMELRYYGLDHDFPAVPDE